VNRIVPQIIAHGKAVRPGIGVSVANEDIAAQLGVKGVIVAGVLEGGPAARAGLVGVDREGQKLGDVIVAIEGEAVSTPGELTARLERIGVGNKATLTVERDGRRRDVTVDVVDIG
jgi:2-alkenal reductase